MPLASSPNGERTDIFPNLDRSVILYCNWVLNTGSRPSRSVGDQKQEAEKLTSHQVLCSVYDVIDENRVGPSLDRRRLVGPADVDMQAILVGLP